MSSICIILAPDFGLGLFLFCLIFKGKSICRRKINICRCLGRNDLYLFCDEGLWFIEKWLASSNHIDNKVEGLVYKYLRPDPLLTEGILCL
jgi:hypothetical protein